MDSTLGNPEPYQNEVAYAVRFRAMNSLADGWCLEFYESRSRAEGFVLDCSDDMQACVIPLTRCDGKRSLSE